MSHGDHQHPNDRGTEETTAPAGFPGTTAHVFLKGEIQDPVAVCDLPKVGQRGQREKGVRIQVGTILCLRLPRSPQISLPSFVKYRLGLNDLYNTRQL